MKETREKYVNGQILLFNKPLAWTSFDLVKKVKNLLRRNLEINKIKVGHAGTLDPLATGLLIVCTGRATKKIQQIQACCECCGYAPFTGFYRSVYWR